MTFAGSDDKIINVADKTAAFQNFIWLPGSSNFLKKVLDLEHMPWYDIKVADGDRTAQEMSVIHETSKKWKKCLTDRMKNDKIIKLSLVRVGQKTTAEPW